MSHSVRRPVRVLLAVLVTFTAGAVVAPAAQAAAPGVIAGILTDFTGAPLVGGQVAYSYVGSWSLPAISGADGSYQLSAPAGPHKVRITAPGGLVQYAPGQSSVDSATVYQVTSGATTTVNDQLLPSGNVRVSLVDRATGAPVSHGCLTVSTTSQGSCDRADGQFSFVGVPPGPWKLTVTGTKTEWPTTTSVTVAPGPADLVVPLDPAAAIATTVSASDNPAVHPNMCVVPVYQGQQSYAITCAPDPATGSLLIGPLPVATSVQLFALPSELLSTSVPGTTYGAQWVAATGGTGDQRQAVKITTGVGTVAQGPPIHVDHAGSISGTIDDTYYGDSGTWAEIRPYGLQDSLRSLGLPYDAPGLGTVAYVGASYILVGLGPYAWPVDFAGERGVYADQWSGNAPDRYRATPIQVRAGQVTTYNVLLRQMQGGVTGEIQVKQGATSGPYFVDVTNAYTGDSTGLVTWMTWQADNAFGISGTSTDPIRIRYGIVDGPNCPYPFTVQTGGNGTIGLVLKLPTPSTCPRPLLPRPIRTGTRPPVSPPRRH